MVGVFLQDPSQRNFVYGLRETRETDFTFSQIVDQHLALKNIDPNEPYLHVIRHIEKILTLSINAKEKRLHELYKEMQEKFFPKDILRNFIFKMLTGPSVVDRPLTDRLWVFRLHFARQLACINLMWYVFSNKNDSPDDITIRTHTGELFSSSYGISGREDRAVPFRLTPNLYEFMGEHVVKGDFSMCFFFAATSLIKVKTHVKNYLYLHSRDDAIHEQMKHVETASSDFYSHISHQFYKDKVAGDQNAIWPRLRALVRAKRKDDKAASEEMMNEAMKETNLSQMPASWLPHF